MISAIRKSGGDPRYTEYADAGHAIAHLAYEKPELLPWMFAQKRSESADVNQPCVPLGQPLYPSA